MKIEWLNRQSSSMFVSRTDLLVPLKLDGNLTQFSIFVVIDEG